MKRIPWTKYWQAFLHWKGWKAIADIFAKAWKCTVRWRGWQWIFGLPFGLIAIACAVSGIGLVWVFASGLENRIFAYVLYALSAYSLAALAIQLPQGIRQGKRWLDRHPQIAAKLMNKELKFQLGLYFEQFINFAYGIFKIVSGLILGSAWIGCDGIYNMTQAFIQLFQILKRKKPGNIEKQWRSYRLCGWLVILLHLTLIGIVFQTINWNRADSSGEIQVIATAAFAFYKIITSFVEIAKDRKHTHPIDSSVRMLELTQAIFAMFSLQASLLHTFGTGERWEHWMNMGTGCVVCLLISATGIYMIRRSSRQLKVLRCEDQG